MGVWGGMSEHERRLFRTHLNREGYRGEVPNGLEFEASVASFYTIRRKAPVRVRDVRTPGGPPESPSS